MKVHVNTVSDRNIDWQNRCEVLEASLQEKMRLATIGYLSGGIAHELKNPLNLIKNFSEVSQEILVELQEALQGTSLSTTKLFFDDLQANHKRIREQADRASIIIEGILNMIRGERASPSMNDLNEVVDTYTMLAYHAMRSFDQDFNVRLEKQYASQIPRLNIVASDIGRAVLNVVDNAIHAVKERAIVSGEDYQPMVRIKTALKKNAVMISIHDNGIGIPKEILKKIFDPFFTTKAIGKGTGLGLSIVWDIIVKNHSGTVEVMSAPSEGATFTFSIPLVATAKNS